MKILGWMLLLTLNNVYAQEVIESTPLSVEDNGARPLLENGSKAVVKEGPKEIIKIEAVEVKPESLESVEIATKNEVKKSSKAAAKKAKAQPKKEIAIDEPALIVTPVVVVPEKVNPIDGQLKLDGPAAEPVVAVKIDEAKVEDKRIDDKKVINVPAQSETVAVVYYENTLKKYLQFSYGYLNSRYEKIHSSLDNGSNVTSLAFVGDMNQKFQLGLAMELLTDTSGQDIPDNIRSVQYRLFGNYHSPLLGLGKVHWIGGLALAIGDYGVRRRYIALSGDEASVKLHDGTIFGLIPAAGVRFYLAGKNSFDLMVEYHQYFGKPQSYIGGLAIAPRISFEF